MSTPTPLGPPVTDLTLEHRAALAHLRWTRDRLAAVGGGSIAFTMANFLALIRSAEGTPYRLGGVDPFNGGADCSGLIYWAGLQCGVTLPRTTSAEWAGLPHVLSTNTALFPIASICEFEVDADGGPVPQHVGVVVAAGVMIDDPFTGAVVRQEAIPNTAAVRLIGYCILPFIPAPPPPPTPEGTMLTQLLASDPKTGGQWVTDPNGDLYVWGAAPFIAGLNQHPAWQAGQAESGGANPCVGVSYWAAFGLDGIIFYTAPAAGVGGWKGTPYDQYQFLRSGAIDGSLSAADDTKLVYAHSVLHPVAVMPDGSWKAATSPAADVLERLGIAA